MDSLADQVKDYIDLYNNVSFAELARKFPEHFKGEYSYTWSSLPNVYAWRGMSEEFTNILLDLVSNKKYTLKPTGWLTYLIDGICLDLPIYKGKKKKIKKPHWLPVVFVSPTPRPPTKPEILKVFNPSF